MSTEFTNGWLYDYQSNHFAPKSFMSLIYDAESGQTVTEYINNHIFEKAFIVDVSHGDLVTFSEMSSDKWPGVTGATKNAIAYGHADGYLQFLATTSSPKYFLMGNTDGVPQFNTVTITSSSSTTTIGMQLRYGTATVADNIITYCDLPYATANQSGVINCAAQTIAGTKTFQKAIVGDLEGNASTADAFSSNKTIALTGDVTGSASGTSGWSIATTLKASGVTAGTYGPTADATLSHGDTLSVPSVTVDEKGRVTSATTRSMKLPSDTKVSQVHSTAASEYPILLKYNTTTTTTANTVKFNSGLTVNPSTGSLTLSSDSAVLSLTGANSALSVAGTTTMNGTIVVGSSNYGTELPASGTPGQIFFLLVE